MLNYFFLLFIILYGAFHHPFISASRQLQCTEPNINWLTSYVSKTLTTLQVVSNPILNPNTSPVAETAWEYLARLGAPMVRYVPWFPYPKVAVAELDPPTPVSTSWNFDDIEPQFRNFMKATYEQGYEVVPNFSTQPTWMYDINSYDYPSDPNKVDWSYVRGSAVNSYTNTTQLVAQYYGRLLSWIIKGSFVDENGITHTNPGQTYQLTHWEVLNEPESEHSFDIETYTKQYDAIVKEVRREVDPYHMISFVGLALAGRELDWIKYFLDPSNHDPEALPVTHISFHFYATSSSRTEPSAYGQFFTDADGFVAIAEEIALLRDTESPETRLHVDEMGVILPNDNDANAAVPPPLYWNAAGAMYAYLYARLVPLGYDVLGESQFAGCPPIPEWDIKDAQYPSVSMVNWTTGVGNARYWVLDLLLQHFAPGDIFVESTVPPYPPTQVICAVAESEFPMNASITCADPHAFIDDIMFAAYGTPTGSCGNYVRSTTCDADNVTDYVKEHCLGENSCSILSYPTFGDPCKGLVKKLVIQATCSGTAGGTGNPSDPRLPLVQGVIDGHTLQLKVLLVNPNNLPSCVTLPGASTQSTVFTVDEASGEGPPRREHLTSDQVTLAPFAVSVVYL